MHTLKLKLAITRRWRKARPGSVLILVVALLVLLALIGTAYLSSTQTERYTSDQNSINTEADLLLQGMIASVEANIAGGLFGTSGAYRPPQQEMPTYSGSTATAATPTGYFNYDSAAVDTTIPAGTNPADLFLGDRLPIASPSGATYPAWNAMSWPLFTDSSGSYTFDSPFGPSFQTGPAAQKGNLGAAITAVTYNGTTYPGIQFYNSTGKYSGPQTVPGPMLGADTDGDGIADAAFTKIPVGQINGITYYVATRVIDGNSAINASSAWTQGADTPFQNVANTALNPATNFGFFRSNIGLQELLYSTADMSPLNVYRFNNSSAALTQSPNTSSSNPPTNFNWFSYGDQMDNQMTRRPGNPDYGASGYPFQWFGLNATSALAYKYCVVNPNLSLSTIEQSTTGLYNELYATAPKSAYSPTQFSQWWTTNFAGAGGLYPSGASYTGTNSSSPLRTLLVGNNAVSNAVPSRYGNTSASSPVAWTLGTAYHFGDWVTDGSGSSTQRSYVCILPHTSSSTTEPGLGTNSNAVGYWAGEQATTVAGGPPPGLPWTHVPVKASVNTAPFDQLWIAFAQVMTDSITQDTVGGVLTGTAQWQPPMQPTAVAAGAEPQMPQFRSTLRSPVAAGTPGRLQLTSSQMLKLRAALAAINATALRNNTQTVPSRRIVLSDSSNNPAYEVEVYGTKMQPYISEMVAQVDTIPANNYIAIELCNPYPYVLYLNNWALCTVDRSAFGTAAGMVLSTPLALSPAATPIQIPAATVTNGVSTPGIAVIASSDTPPNGINNVATSAGTNFFLCPSLTTAIGRELVLLRPRVYNATSNATTTNTLSTSTDPADTYAESNTTALGCADLVPVDQLDLTGADTLAATYAAQTPPVSPPIRLQYRRGSLPATPAVSPAPQAASYAWNFVYPGQYDPTASAAANPPLLRMKGIVQETSVTTLGPGNLGLPDGGPVGNSAPTSTGVTYATAPLQLANMYMGGPNPLDATIDVSATPNPKYQYPFGQFARNADMLQIPFIGAYRIRALTPSAMAAGSFTELNSVTMDSALATDTTLPAAEVGTAGSGLTAVPSVYIEQIGRFCPVGDPGNKTLDFNNNASSGPATWHYHWAKRLFDYLTVQSPQDDYYPNADPAVASTAYLPPSDSVSPPIPAKYPGGISPVPVANSNSAVANVVTPGTSEDTVGVEGLININTAPAPVLAQLPFTGTAASPSTSTNAMIAEKIVEYRNANGPFKSIFDLYNVPAFLAQNNSLLTTDPGPAQGDFSPGGFPSTATPTPTTDNVRYDFKERFLLLNNISNLITTRSDTFTCYILLQGWRNVGTSNPTLAVQRRAAFLLDRNAVTPSNNAPTIFKVPTD